MAAGGFADRRPLPRLARRLCGRFVGDRGYISGGLAENLLVSRGVRLITKLPKNMRHRLPALPALTAE